MERRIEERLPQWIRELDPYKPGKPVEEVERELKVRAVKLASNENALGPSPKAVAAIQQAAKEANRYPDGGGYYLREKLASRLGVGMDNILLGNGSSDLIELAARSLLTNEDEAATSEGSFPLYYLAIREMGARLVAVPQKNYGYDLEALGKAVGLRTKLIYVANPNNPTGTLFTANEFDEFLKRVPEDVVVVLDEAYYEYVERRDYSRSIELVKQGRNLLVLRTFSKVYGLAGLRIGYAVGPAVLVEHLNKVRSPFNTSVVAQAAALAALEDTEHVRRSVESNRAGMKQLGEGLKALGITFVPSYGNFVLVELGGDSRLVAEELMKLGVIVRPMRWMGFPNAIRVTVGTREENEKFLKALERVRVEAK